MVQPRPAGPVFLLEADLPGAVGNLAWSVRSSDGRTTFDGVGPSPEPGHSFKVLVLAARLEAGEYTFTVRSNAGNEWLFRFRTGPR